ncbi:c-type cytochrome [Longimicrobium terrae]|uniref:Mono/diheme cytochrome c family protein n=1 Tax=Longimicrobium terrae TaxID=1639882 RepID=A0A841GYG2_9BACT|nr:c-type cytochrome [Longimicrobium terrae]MBB4636676.1 mono/diheme cytochrome c family protein [Longimicrobium terrae]MBB6070800.1 mono/diheme cytochrome c family protein [Longimicrobium terrae]NNC28826.1 c-type cytochrome [Longimicrobium terrae]
MPIPRTVSRHLTAVLLLLAAAACGVEADPARRRDDAAETSATRAGSDSATKPSSESLVVVTASGTRTFTLAELRRALPTDTALVRHDPAYEGRAKRYAGVPLDRLLALAGVTMSADEVLYFVAADGYRATMAQSAADPRIKGIIAFADLDAPAGSAWQPVRHGAQSISPAPFYLVWGQTGAAPGDTADAALRRPWPYQLARIEVVDPRKRYDRLYPTGVSRDDPVYRGFQAFVIESHGGDQCVACHALNRQGGSVGPELNVPRNITEYRDAATLAAFIRNARAFRAGTAMPVFEGRLSDREIEDILAYLRWMRGHKVPLDSTGAAR